MINAFTVDVEDYYHVSGFEVNIDRGLWHGFESRVCESTGRILRMLAQHNVLGTFFVLGWVAAKHPELVQKIQAAGHEIGSHSYWHRLVYTQTPGEFREDLRRSRDILQSITGQAVKAYRAPSFSITERSIWALEILLEEGFCIDSSVFPVVHDRYGIPHARRDPHSIQTPSGTLWEFPPTVVRQARINVPVGGGGYFRLFPYSWTARWLKQIHRREQRPAMFYMHPWEVDPGQPKLNFGGLKNRFRHYVNLESTERKLHRLLNQFSFSTLSNALAEHSAAPTLEVAA